MWPPLGIPMLRPSLHARPASSPPSNPCCVFPFCVNASLRQILKHVSVESVAPSFGEESILGRDRYEYTARSMVDSVLYIVNRYGPLITHLIGSHRKVRLALGIEVVDCARVCQGRHGAVTGSISCRCQGNARAGQQEVCGVACRGRATGAAPLYALRTWIPRQGLPLMAICRGARTWVSHYLTSAGRQAPTPKWAEALVQTKPEQATRVCQPCQLSNIPLVLLTPSS